MRRRRAVPIVLAVVVLAYAVPLAWMGATPITYACDEPALSEEGSAESDSHTSLWPPGVECVTRHSDGSIARTTYIIFL